MFDLTRWIRPAGIALLSLAPVACDNLTGSDSSEVDLDLDVAAMAAELALEDVAELISLNEPSFSLMPTDPSDQVTESTTHSVTRTFYDEFGVEMGMFDPLLTEAVRVQRSWSRERARAGWSGSTSREYDRTTSGLLGAETERTTNGTGSGQIERSRFSDTRGDREYDMTWTTAIEDFVRSVDRLTNPYPLSGTITRDVTVTRTRPDGTEEIRMRHTVITFDGTRFATLLVNDEEFEIDLAVGLDGSGSPVRRR